MTEGRSEARLSALVGNRQASASRWPGTASWRAGASLGLRPSEGLDLDRLAVRSGLQPKAHVVQELSDAGLVECLGLGRLRATRSGRIVLNAVVLRLAAALEPATSTPTRLRLP